MQTWPADAKAKRISHLQAAKFSSSASIVGSCSWIHKFFRTTKLNLPKVEVKWRGVTVAPVSSILFPVWMDFVENLVFFTFSHGISFHKILINFFKFYFNSFARWRNQFNFIISPNFNSELLEESLLLRYFIWNFIFIILGYFVMLKLNILKICVCTDPHPAWNTLWITVALKLTISSWKKLYDSDLYSINGFSAHSS